MTGKFSTAVRLLARAEWAIFRRQIRWHWRNHRLRAAGSRPFIHTTAGHPLVCFPDWPDSVWQYLHGSDDRWEIALLRSWLEPGDVFVDAGANMGLYAHAVASHFGGDVRVLALEASPALVERLHESARLLGEREISAIPVAVGAEEGQVTFYLARAGATTVSQSMRVDATEAADYVEHLLPMRTLAALAGEHLAGRSIAAVKVDVEGAEPLALRGAPRHWFSSDGAAWVVEINPSALARMGFRPEDVFTHFPGGSFEQWILPKYPKIGQPPPRPRRLKTDERFDDAPFYNLIALPAGRAADARRTRVRRFFT